jgi:hypothetical protein
MIILIAAVILGLVAGYLWLSVWHYIWPPRGTTLAQRHFRRRLWWITLALIYILTMAWYYTRSEDFPAPHVGWVHYASNQPQRGQA